MTMIIADGRKQSKVKSFDQLWGSPGVYGEESRPFHQIPYGRWGIHTSWAIVKQLGTGHETFIPSMRRELSNSRSEPYTGVRTFWWNGDPKDQNRIDSFCP